MPNGLAAARVLDPRGSAVHGRLDRRLPLSSECAASSNLTGPDPDLALDWGRYER
jgi:hypothetical protein